MKKISASLRNEMDIQPCLTKYLIVHRYLHTASSFIFTRQLGGESFNSYRCAASPMQHSPRILFAEPSMKQGWNSECRDVPRKTFQGVLAFGGSFTLKFAIFFYVFKQLITVTYLFKPQILIWGLNKQNLKILLMSICV